MNQLGIEEDVSCEQVNKSYVGFGNDMCACFCQNLMLALGLWARGAFRRCEQEMEAKVYFFRGREKRDLEALLVIKRLTWKAHARRQNAVRHA